MKFFFNQMLKISAFYVEKQKSFIPKQIWFKPRVNWLQYQNKPALFTDPIFSDGFDSNHQTTSLKIFKHYKLKPSFSIIKDNKILDMAGVGDKSPFGRSINPNLNQFSFFNSIGYLKMIKKMPNSPCSKIKCRASFYQFAKSNLIQRASWSL